MVPHLCLVPGVDSAPVQILESASELKEVGAALSVGAGAGKILRRFGIDLAQEGGIVPDNVAIWTTDGNKIAEHPPPSAERFGDHIVSAKRLDLLSFSEPDAPT
jgi:2-polyprenyl-6-methoxyphenol hydroxylase-like FAD-dependent oxidoreductase